MGLIIGIAKANPQDAEEIGRMKQRAFESLRHRPVNLPTGLLADSSEKMVELMRRPGVDYFMIEADGVAVGALRLLRLWGGDRYRISPIVVLPEFRHRGIGQRVLRLLEGSYHPRTGWELDVILEETRECPLFERLGYRRTGMHIKINQWMTIARYEKGVRSGARSGFEDSMEEPGIRGVL